MSITPKTLYLLQALKGSRTGAAIYQHVQSVLEDFEAHTHQTQDAYRKLVQVLLEETARLLPADSPLLVHLKLIKMRLSLPASADEIRSLGEQIRSLFATLGEELPVPTDALHSSLQEGTEEAVPPEEEEAARPATETTGQGAAPAATPAAPSAASEASARTAAMALRSALQAEAPPEARKETGTETERAGARAPAAPSPASAAPAQAAAQPPPRRPPEEWPAEESTPAGPAPNTQSGTVLEDKRQRIREIQKTLASHLGEVIKQNEKFGILLEVGHESLRQMDNIDEIGNLKEALIREVTRLREGHQELTRKLESANRYLQIIESEGQYLNDELTRVHILSLTDELTDLPNRRAFMRRLEDEVARVQRYGSPLTLALVDMDGFKKINDTYGHAAGDEVLRNFAHNILSIFRHHDMVARYGGEEFAVILPNTDQHGALRALQKVQKRNAESPYHFNGETRPMPTFSAGIALYRPGETPSSLIERADKALYKAKRLGRNRIELANSDLEATAH